MTIVLAVDRSWRARDVSGSDISLRYLFSKAYNGIMIDTQFH
jgi:hypothetical protein